MRYLTDEEENELASFTIGSASISYLKTIKEILVIVQTILHVEFNELSLTGGGKLSERGIPILHLELHLHFQKLVLWHLIG